MFSRQSLARAAEWCPCGPSYPAGGRYTHFSFRCGECYSLFRNPAGSCYTHFSNPGGGCYTRFRNPMTKTEKHNRRNGMCTMCLNAYVCVHGKGSQVKCIYKTGVLAAQEDRIHTNFFFRTPAGDSYTHFNNPGGGCNTHFRNPTTKTEKHNRGNGICTRSSACFPGILWLEPRNGALAAQESHIAFRLNGCVCRLSTGEHGSRG